MFSIEKGRPILGCTQCLDYMQWGIYAPKASGMLLKVYRQKEDELPILECMLNRLNYATGDVFHIALKALDTIEAYTWQLKDEADNLSECLLDPYCKSVYGDRNLIVEDLHPVTLRPCIPWEKTIIYELHVGHFTKDISSGVSELKRGTFLGLMEKLLYLKSLGVTTIELLPVFKWNKHTLQNKHPETGEQLKDEWGYNTIAFFALDEQYGVEQCHIREEFLACVEAAHTLGMEIVLDVVYNHTGEGGEGGQIFNFKQLGDEQYYKKNNQHYINCSGTGNVFNNTHIVVKNLVLDSLRYWVTQFGVDGFRFDLASILQQDEYGRWYTNGLMKDIANDPILRSVKLISESWDAKGSYDVGRMPHPVREWSDFFRDTIRKAVRGDMGMTRELAQCIVGEDIHYVDAQKGPWNSIHFITAHDGFTMWDLVSYNTKHNELNGECNRDGHNGNYSHNCGQEGDTLDETIINLRFKRMKNYFALLLLSYGVPMLLMGDECARSQRGNNNAFCQNNELVWLKWKNTEQQQQLKKFVEQMIEMRKEMKWLDQQASIVISWHGVKYGEPDWSYYSCSLAWEIKNEKEKAYIILNNYVEELVFELPPTQKKWRKRVDTDKRQSVLQYVYYGDAKERVAPYSLCIFREE